MKTAIIVAVVGGGIIGTLIAFANELGRFCEDTNPYQGLPVHEECETCGGQYGDCASCLKLLNHSEDKE